MMAEFQVEPNCMRACAGVCPVDVAAATVVTVGKL